MFNIPQPALDLVGMAQYLLFTGKVTLLLNQQLIQRHVKQIILYLQTYRNSLSCTHVKQIILYLQTYRNSLSCTHVKQIILYLQTYKNSLSCTHVKQIILYIQTYRNSLSCTHKHKLFGTSISQLRSFFYKDQLFNSKRYGMYRY